MLLQHILLLAVFTTCGAVYSSFWAPLFNRTVLNYRVDAPFDPDSGVKAREQYKEKYGYRGEKLIEDLGNGKGPRQNEIDNQIYGDVTVYYT